jgi:hypothetical protein
MQIYLPSNGRIEINKVNMRQPKISDIRESQEFSNDLELRKTQFVRLLCGNDPNVDCLTLYDRNYLFVIAVASLTLNKLSFKAKCSHCGAPISDFIDITQLDVVFLEEDIECIKNIEGTDYKFRLLRVRDEVAALDYANLDDKHYESRLEDAYVCASLGMEINDENIEKVKNLDLSVYYSAQFFQICLAHGLSLQKHVSCKKCGAVTNVILDIKGNMLNMDMSIIMDRYAALAGKLDYQSFLDMTLPEYNFLVDSLNSKMENT